MRLVLLICTAISLATIVAGQIAYLAGRVETLPRGDAWVYVAPIWLVWKQKEN